MVKFLSTFFYIGYLPKAPGSIATMAGIGIAFCLRNYFPLYALTFAMITLLGFWSAGRMETLIGAKDPSCIVIDEVSGVMIAFFMLPWSWSTVWTGFFLFRAFDMFKIYPANRLEKLPGSRGVMMDDILAGIYTNITMHIALRSAGIAF